MLLNMKAYQQIKGKMSAARREFVAEVGWKQELPSALWPHLPSKEYAAWVPPVKWLSSEQLEEPISKVYIAQAISMIESGNSHCNSKTDIEWYQRYLDGLGLLPQ